MANYVIVIAIEITEYHPESLNFEPFGFVFRSESKDFEQEITVNILFII